MRWAVCLFILIACRDHEPEMCVDYPSDWCTVHGRPWYEEFEWDDAPHRMIRVPAGYARGTPCPSAVSWDYIETQWVDEFEIDEFPARDFEYRFFRFGVFWDPMSVWLEPSTDFPEEVRLRDSVSDVRGLAAGRFWHDLVMTPYISDAERYCRSRGLDLPTVAELHRAARDSRDSYEWGEHWGDRENNQRVCFTKPPWTIACPWPSSRDVVFALYDMEGGEWARWPGCPVRERDWVDFTGLRGHETLDGHLFRCVRRHPPPWNPLE